MICCRESHRWTQFVCLVLVFVLTVVPGLPASAQSSTSTMQGSVTSESDGLPVAGAVVVLVGGTEHYTTTTDKKGAFTIVGLVPGVYILSIEKNGFDSYVVRDLAIASGQIESASAVLVPTLAVIGRVGGVASKNSAFQPGLTTNSYSASGDLLKTLLGRDYNPNQTQLLQSIPSVTLDEHGGVFIRGGNAFQTKYELDGVDLTTPNMNVGNPFNCPKFQNRQDIICNNQSVTNIANFGVINGIGSVQVTPGGSDASQGDSGTGVISYGVKRGTPKGFATLDVESNVYPNDGQLSFEFGKATADGRFSAYIASLNRQQNFQYGYATTPAYQLAPGDATGVSYQSTNDTLGNFIFKFGRDQRQSIQLLADQQYALQHLIFGGLLGTPYEVGAPDFTTLVFNQNHIPFNTADLQRFYPLFPGEPSYGANLTTANTPDVENHTYLYKIQYSNNFSPNSYLSADFFRQQNSQQAQEGVARGLYEDNFGGWKDGVNLQFSTQANAHNLVQLGGSFEYSHPTGRIFNDDVHMTTFYANSWAFPFRQPLTVGSPIFDFLPANDPNCAAINAQEKLNYPAPQVAPQLHDCGYLAQFFPGQSTLYLPQLWQVPITNEQTSGIYLQDTFSPSSKLRLQFGGRLETYIQSSVPNDDINVSALTLGTGGIQGPVNIRASQIQPHSGVSYELSPHDSLRANYGRTIAPQVPGTTGTVLDNSLFSQFANIPSHDAITGGPAMYCGPTFNQPCKNYADELYWALTSASQLYYGNLEPAKATTYANYDLSYQHQFAHNIGFRATGYYRRGYNLIEEATEYLGFNPVTQTANTSVTSYTNDGIDRATGLELSLTREAPVGLVGAVSLTYLNERTSANAFTSFLSAASLALGDTYRVQTFSPLQLSISTAYKTHNGLRFGVQMQFNEGYPYGQGTTVPIILNGIPTVVPFTNAEGGTNSLLVDPENPGKVTSPVIAARWGSPDTSSSGGLLSPATINTNLTIEFSKPGSHTTVGMGVFNVFNQLYTYPYANNLLQRVATGVAGPLTGISTCNGAAALGNFTINNGPAIPPAFLNPTGCSLNGTPNYYANSGYTQPYVIFPDGQPRELRLYVQVHM